MTQFLIVLPRTDPLVWRRIQVSESYSFWDLHVALQDAMGWLDCHLHEFEVLDSRTKRLVLIGIPDDEFPGERPCLAGWKVVPTENSIRPRSSVFEPSARRLRESLRRLRSQPNAGFETPLRVMKRARPRSPVLQADV